MFANTNTSVDVRIIHRHTHAHAHTHERTHALQHILLHSYIDAHERAHKHTDTHTHTHRRARKRTHACILAHTERIHALISTTHTQKQVHIRKSSRIQTQTSTHINEKTRCNTCAWHADAKRYPLHLLSWKTTRRKKCASYMRRQYQRLQHDKTGRLSCSRMCKRMHETY